MSRPNVLFILTDDRRCGTISALGNPEIHPPNLDRAAGCFRDESGKYGAQYRQAYRDYGATALRGVDAPKRKSLTNQLASLGKK